VQLLLLDRESARDLIREEGGSEEDWRLVLGLIDSNHLQRVAGYPAALRQLYALRRSTGISIKEVWGGESCRGCSRSITITTRPCNSRPSRSHHVGDLRALAGDLTSSVHC
jgi:hypothetical protein